MDIHYGFQKRRPQQSRKSTHSVVTSLRLMHHVIPSKANIVVNVSVTSLVDTEHRQHPNRTRLPNIERGHVIDQVDLHPPEPDAGSRQIRRRLETS